MNVKSYIGNPRITDYSFDLADYIYNIKNKVVNTDLINLYKYHINLCKPPNALYPQSNWQPHRLCLLSAIAVRLNNTSYISECHTLAIKWIDESDCNCCTAASQDYHWRDSCQYKVYGWWALCASFVYLQPKTNFAYKPLFNDYMKWLLPYQKGLIHNEYVKSNVSTDVSKPLYKKPFDPSYNDNLMVWYNQLKK